MDENNVSFQNLMFLILLSFIALGSESQIFVNSSTQTSVFYFIFFLQGGEGMCRSQNLEIVIFLVKKKLHTALSSVQFLTSFISFHFEILSYLACGEKIVRLASKNSVKSGKK